MAAAAAFALTNGVHTRRRAFDDLVEPAAAERDLAQENVSSFGLHRPQRRGNGRSDDFASADLRLRRPRDRQGLAAGQRNFDGGWQNRRARKTLNRYFNQGIGADDVIWRYAGIRPLYDDGRQDAFATTRDYVIELEAGDGAPLISIIGGKLTTFRRLSENVLERLKPLLGFSGASWTERAKLPGGDMEEGFEAFLQQMGDRYPWLPKPMLTRLCGAYGSRVARILQDAQRLDDLGRHHGATLYQKEVDYLREVEWAVAWEDILMRRTKLWFHLSPNERASFVSSCEAPYELGK